MSEITKIKVNGDPESSYQLYPRNEEFAKRAGGNTGSQSGSSIPKPLTYDYMPDGYPYKAMGTIMLMEEQELAFTSSSGVYSAILINAFEIVVGQTYTVKWDGTEYECVGVVSNSMTLLGNLSISGAGDDTGEPFIYRYSETDFMGQFATLDTSASHTISVKTIGEIVTPMAEEFLPAGVRTAALIYNFGGNRYSSKLTYDELYERLLDGKQVVLHRIGDKEYLYLTKWKKNEEGSISLAFGGANYSVSLHTDGTFRPIFT